MSATKSKVLICPYCGDTQAAGERCRVCGGLFEPLSRQASHNGMGPWFIRDERRPFQPGASYETIVKLIERGQVTRYSIIRCPTTKQFWTIARRVPGIAHLLGYCHNCDATVGKDDHGCPACGVPFGAYLDRNYLGLPEVKPLPWEAPADDTRQPAGPVVDFRRAAEPLGLSSFASDDELRGMAARSPHVSPSSAHPVQYADEPNMNGGGHAAASAGGAPLGLTRRESVSPDHGADPATRAMQRRVQRQAQQIRWLTALLGVVALLAAVTIGAMILRAGDDDGSANNPQPPLEGTRQPAVVSPAEPSAGEDPSLPAAAESALDRDLSPSSQPVGDGLTAPAAEVEPAASITVDHERALGLLVEAGKDNRPLKDRIRDAETAVNLLKSIRAGTTAMERPEGLNQQIVEAERLLERLRLEEFFP